MKPFTRSMMAAALLGFALIQVWATPARADLKAVGTEFQINTYTTYAQYNRFEGARAVAASADGSFVVVWSSYQDGSGAAVVGQRFNSAGSKNGAEFVINTYTSDYQYRPAVAAAADGRFVVTWHSYQDGSGYGIVGQRFDSAGAKDGAEFLVNTYTTSGQYYPDVSMNSDGAFVVAWRGYDGNGNGVFARRFASSGAPEGDDFRVNAYTTNNQRSPKLAMGEDGTFVVVWHSYQDGGGGSIHARRFDPNGAPSGADFQVNTYTTGAQYYPAVAIPADGSFVVVWNSEGPDGDGYGIQGRRFDSAGAPTGAEFRVNAQTTGGQRQPAVAAGLSGGFVVVWQDSDDGDGNGIRARRLDNTGTPSGAEFQANAYTTGSQGYSQSVSGDGSGGFVVVWSDGDQDGDSYGMFGRRLCEDANGDGNCDTFALCRPAPATTCLEAKTAKLQFNEKKAGKEKMQILWSKIATATTQGDFGDPVNGDTGVAVCVYRDDDTLVAEFLVERGGDECDGKPCWKAKGTKGYGYKDKAAASAGVGKIAFTSGDPDKGKAMIAAKNNDAKGMAGLQTGVVAALTLNTAPTVQIIAGGGQCISAEINSISKDDGEQYKAARVE